MEKRIRLLITTDNHLGYKEKDVVRVDDSFVSFEEILSIPSSTPIDAVLILGDLFHEANTTYATLNRCMDILEKTVAKKKQIKTALDLDNPESYKIDNKSTPVVLIHGNHDQPISQFKNGSLDILEKAGYVTYIGKYFNYDSLEINPFFIKKSGIKIAVYGLGYIKDTKLNSLLRNGKVSFGDHDNADYCLLVVHQNRYKGGRNGCPAKNCLNLSLLPQRFFDLVLWGHEHESFGLIEEHEESGLRVYQPGSSVATSLIRAEAVQKTVGILEFKIDKFDLDPVVIKTQRPIILDEIIFSTFIAELKKKKTDDNRDLAKKGKGDFSNHFSDKSIEEEFADFIIKKNNLIKNKDVLPLLRIKVQLADGESLGVFEVQAKLYNYVANKT